MDEWNAINEFYNERRRIHTHIHIPPSYSRLSFDVASPHSLFILLLIMYYLYYLNYYLFIT